MAKILPGIAVAKMSGTIGGTTYSNYRGMLVARTKPVPTKTLTARQMFINALMSLLSKAWRDELNQGLRTAWNQRAKNYPWVDVFGNERKMTGENLYIKQNMVLLDHSLARQDVPVPDTEPPELLDLAIISTDEQLELGYQPLSAAVIGAQTPFLDVMVAGGYLTSQAGAGVPIESYITSLCLSAGRIQQKSDLRHVLYIDDVAIQEPPVENNTLVITPPEGQTRNVSVVVRRYNKYGNFTAPILLSAIITVPSP